jgi:hypothetical protein
MSGILDSLGVRSDAYRILRKRARDLAVVPCMLLEIVWNICNPIAWYILTQPLQTHGVSWHPIALFGRTKLLDVHNMFDCLWTRCSPPVTLHKAHGQYRLRNYCSWRCIGWLCSI